ncbi:MAG: HlyD family type I secretion periplasmic adaptor subunit [Methylococcaceae bacterium]|nr:HlyD family type I secretion periplasmic adaptor subunit [Methylococcaceae bacterium]
MFEQILLPSIPIDRSGESARLARRGTLAMIVFFGGLGGWAVTVPISGAIVADGTIKVDTHRKTIQHLEGGIVKEIRVREGSVVQAGEPLLILEDTVTRSKMNILNAQSRLLKAREARLLAEKALAAKVDFPPQLEQDAEPQTVALLNAERARFQTRRDALLEEQRLVREELEQAKQSITHLNAEIAAIREGIEFGARQLDASRKLLDKKFIQESEIWRLANENAAKKERLAQQQAVMTQTREHIAELDLRLAQAKNVYVMDADNELKVVKKDMIQVEEELHPANSALSREVITAPLSGQVLDLKVTTVGGVVKAGDPLMDIVPASRDMVMEVRVKNRDVDDVHVGQETRVQLSAFNANTTPMITGKVTYVAGDALQDPNTHESYYPAHVRVTEQDLQPVADKPLAPGMPVVAFINTGSRTFADYLLAPIVERARKAVKEQ